MPDMPTIEITAHQAEYLDGLRTSLVADNAGEYATVTDADALQYLIDHVEGDAEQLDAAGATDSDGDAENRMDAMLNLLTEHNDRWEEADGEQGKYAVTLPDGSVEHVRTKDDVKAVLFKHY